jgi:hypothetical protein
MSELSTSQWIGDDQNAIVRAERGDNPRIVAERNSPLGGLAGTQRRLLIREEVLWLLHLSDEQLQLLINTRQITVIRIAGEERFDSRDLDQLISSYKATAARRAQ